MSLLESSTFHTYHLTVFLFLLYFFDAVTMLRILGNGIGGAGGLRRSLLSLPRSARYFTSTRVVGEKAEEQPKPQGIPYDKLTVGVPKENYPLEKRVGATPESVSKLVAPGFGVLVEKGAGELSYFADADYQAAGATIVDSVWKDSDIVLKVRSNSFESSCTRSVFSESLP